MQIDSELIIVGLDVLESLGCRLEWLVSVHSRRVLDEGQTHVPNKVATLDDEVGVGEPFVGDHGSIHDFQGLNPTFEVFKLSLERVQFHASLWVDVCRWLSQEQFSFGVLGPNLGSERSLAGSGKNIASTFSVINEPKFHSHSAALGQSIELDCRYFGGLCRCGVITRGNALGSNGCHRCLELLLNLSVWDHSRFDLLDDE